MKKLIQLLVAFMALTTTYGQKIFPTPADHPFWIEGHGVLWGGCSCGGCGNYFCDCTNPVFYRYDSVINSKTYNCYYSYGVCTATYTGGGPPPWPCQYSCSYSVPESLFAMIRVDTIAQQVFIYTTGESLLYDFSNLMVGQVYPATYSNNHYPDLIIVSEDSLLLHGTYYKRWGLGLNNGGTITDSNYIYIIKGIGSTYGICPSNYDVPFENSDALQCFSLENTVIYPDSAYYCDQTVSVPDDLKAENYIIYPNPTNGKLTIETPGNPGRYFLTVANAEGQELIKQMVSGPRAEVNISKLSAGVYFVKLFNEGMIKIKEILVN